MCARASEKISDALEPDSRDRVKVTFTRRRRRAAAVIVFGFAPAARAVLSFAGARGTESPPRQYLSVVTGRRSCQQAVFNYAVSEPIGEYKNDTYY